MTKKNYCCAEHLLSTCSAADPKKCKYYKPARYHSRCIHQTIELDWGYNCGCIRAREENKVIELDVDEILFIESEEGDVPT